MVNTVNAISADSLSVWNDMLPDCHNDGPHNVSVSPFMSQIQHLKRILACGARVKKLALSVCVGSYSCLLIVRSDSF